MSDDRNIAKKYKVGDSLFSAFQRVYGKVKRIDWSVSFGQWSYLIEKANKCCEQAFVHDLVWVCESDLKPVYGKSVDVLPAYVDGKLRPRVFAFGGRILDNADQDRYTHWTIMLPHETDETMKDRIRRDYEDSEIQFIDEQQVEWEKDEE